MSKYIFAGESVASFCNRGGKGCWIVRTKQDATKLSHMIGARMRGELIKGIKYHTAPVIWEEKGCETAVKYCLVVSAPIRLPK